MTTQFPVEIWEKILKYTISVPLFFEADPASSFGPESIPQYYYEANYWTSERLRNTTRRVCSSWNIFLRAYNHRYVCLADVFHHEVPTSAIPMAIRLNIGSHTEYKYREYLQLDERILGRRMSLLRNAMEIKSGNKNDEYLIWRTEILHGQLPEHAEDLETLWSRAPRLRAVVGCHSLDMDSLDRRREKLLFLSMSGDWQGPFASNQPFHFTHLTTLCVHISSLDLAAIHWDLPSLQHLSVHNRGSVEEGGRCDIVRLLEKVGDKLLTFYLHDDPHLEDAPNKVWELLPHVVRLQLPYWGTLSSPSGHPVRFARISIDTTAEALNLGGRRMRDMIAWLPKWATSLPSRRQALNDKTSHLIVQMDQTWLWVLTDQETHSCTWLSLGIAEYYREAGVRFADSEGVSFDEYLIFIIRCYWRNGLATRRRFIPAGGTFHF